MPVLIGLGVRELSVVPAQIPRIKSLLRSLALGACAELAQRALKLDERCCGARAGARME